MWRVALQGLLRRFWGLLAGFGILVIPGVGPIAAVGSIGTAFASTLAGSGIDAVAGSLAGAFAEVGLCEERVKGYSYHVSQGGYVTIMDGTDEVIYHAESVLNAQRV